MTAGSASEMKCDECLKALELTDGLFSFLWGFFNYQRKKKDDTDYPNKIYNS